MKVVHILLLVGAISILTFNATHGSKIIHGKQAEKNSLQYMASVQEYGVHMCGGFLIHPRYVLTAAHCERHALTVVLGTHNINPGRSDLRRYIVQRKYKYPLYEKPFKGYDIMLLELSEKISPNDEHVKTVNIPTAHQKVEPDTKCQIAGWGTTENMNSVYDLRVTDVPIINMTICKKLWNNKEFQLPRSIVCAGGYNTESGACQGDSGGPLVCNGQAVGVVSFNYNLDCKYPNVPNVYTDISAYTNWIKSVIG